MFVVAESSAYQCYRTRFDPSQGDHFTLHTPLRGIAWSDGESDPIQIRSCDRFLQYPSNKDAVFETPEDNGARKHRSCWHVKVEGTFRNHGHLSGPIVHGNVSAEPYLRSDYVGPWIHVQGSPYDGSPQWYCSTSWTEVIVSTSDFALLREITLIQDGSQFSPFTTVSIQHWYQERGDRESHPVPLHKLWLSPQPIYEEGFDVIETAKRDYTSLASPPRMYYGADHVVDYAQFEAVQDLLEKGKTRIPTLEYYELDVESEPIPLETIVSDISRITNFVFSTADSVDPYQNYWRDVASNDAISHSYCNDGNAYEFWKDVPAFGIEIKDITKVLVNKGKDFTIKNVSKAYLSTHYGSKLTLSDLQKWQKAMTEYSWRNKADHCKKVVSKRSYDVSSPYLGLDDGECTLTYGLYYDPHWDKQTWKQVTSEMGFDLSGQHVWELVPFSFVVDWFHNFSNDLEAVHSGTRLLQLDVYGEEVGCKYKWPLISYEGLTLTFYHRRASKVATANPIPAPTEGGQWKSHWLEGAALILSH